jgi:hypothetical protein
MQMLEVNHVIELFTRLDASPEIWVGDPVQAEEYASSLSPPNKLLRFCGCDPSVDEDGGVREEWREGLDNVVLSGALLSCIRKFSLGLVNKSVEYRPSNSTSKNGWYRTRVTYARFISLTSRSRCPNVSMVSCNGIPMSL